MAYHALCGAENDIILLSDSISQCMKTNSTARSFIGEGGKYLSPRYSRFNQIWVLAAQPDQDEIWHRTALSGYSFACHISSWSVKVCGYRSGQKNLKFFDLYSYLAGFVATRRCLRWACRVSWRAVQVFDGNTDSYTVKHSYLDEPMIARFVRFHTLQWHGHPSLRVEIIGCQGRL